MIILDNNEKDIVIPDYNDLDNKPSINGVVLEGNKTAAELGIDIDTTNFYTKGQADGRFQLKGNYLTSIPAEYITETELNRKDFATNSDVNDEIGKLDSALSGEISKKQNALVSGENIKTINGISLLGNGNIEISGGESVDLSDYYTKGEVDNLIDNVEVDLTGYATETYVSENYQPKGNYLTSIPSEYVTETELTNKGYATTTQLNSKQDILVSGTNIKTINGESILGSGDLTIESGGTTIPTMFIPQGASGTVDLSILTPVVDAIRNNTPWIVWGYMDATQGNYNMVECSSFSGDTITFYDNNLLNSIIRYWTFNLTDGTFTRSDNQLNYATKSYVDTQIGDINTILENIIG